MAARTPLEDYLDSSAELLAGDFSLVDLQGEDQYATPSNILVDRKVLLECPNQALFIDQLRNHVNRKDALKSMDKAMSLCVLVLSSQGYMIRPGVVADASNAIIEKVWNVLTTIRDLNNNESMKAWLGSMIGNRDHVKYKRVHGERAAPKVDTERVGSLLPRDAEFVEEEYSGHPVHFHRDDMWLSAYMAYIRRLSSDLRGGSQ